MRPLVAVDWGTTSLRAARLNAQGEVLEERAGAHGILSVPAGGFPAVLDEFCGDWLRADAALCLVSGMAGSRQGWHEAPYCACPAGLAELASEVAWVEPGRVAIVPGMRCEHAGVPDVMRGEEVQVLGALSLLAASEGWFVLPGTHSKWVRVAGGRIESFRTFMTGEFYALLRRHSILARTLPEDDGALDALAFERGLAQARASANLLQSAFSARTLALFERMPTAALPSYLSGLVIGEELRAQAGAIGDLGQVTLIASEALGQRYQLALSDHGIAARRLDSQATWRGLWAIARELSED